MQAQVSTSSSFQATNPAQISAHLGQARTELADRLKNLDPVVRVAAMEFACIRYGGTFVDDKQSAHLFAEISVLGIYEQGADSEEAVANWIKAIDRMARELAA